MEKRDLTCIGCPLGCQITVTMENGEVTDVKVILVLVEINMQEKK